MNGFTRSQGFEAVLSKAKVSFSVFFCALYSCEPTAFHTYAVQEAHWHNVSKEFQVVLCVANGRNMLIVC